MVINLTILYGARRRNSQVGSQPRVFQHLLVPGPEPQARLTDWLVVQCLLMADKCDRRRADRTHLRDDQEPLQPVGWIGAHQPGRAGRTKSGGPISDAFHCLPYRLPVKYEPLAVFNSRGDMACSYCLILANAQ